MKYRNTAVESNFIIVLGATDDRSLSTLVAMLTPTTIAVTINDGRAILLYRAVYRLSKRYKVSSFIPLIT